LRVLAGVTGVEMPSDRFKTPSTEIAAQEPSSTAPPRGRKACSNSDEEVSRASTDGVLRADRIGVCGVKSGRVSRASGGGGSLLS
jgi:hypothetical protein